MIDGGSGTPLTEETRDYLVMAMRNEELCRWFEHASAVDKLAYIAENDPPQAWHRSSGT